MESAKRERKKTVLVLGPLLEQNVQGSEEEM